MSRQIRVARHTEHPEISNVVGKQEVGGAIQKVGKSGLGSFPALYLHEKPNFSSYVINLKKIKSNKKSSQKYTLNSVFQSI